VVISLKGLVRRDMDDHQLAAIRKRQQDRWRSRSRSRSPNNPSASSKGHGGNDDKEQDEEDDDDVICLSSPVQASAYKDDGEVVCLGSSSSSGIAGTLRGKRNRLSDDVPFDKGKKHTGVVAKVAAGGLGGTYTLTDSHPMVHDDGGWLRVNDPIYKKNFPSECRADDPGDVDNLKAQFKQAKRERKRTDITHDFVLELAKKNGVLYGKWLLLISPEHVVESWTKVRNAVVNGDLGPSAKISVTPDGTHVVCVYCPDFTDSEELLRVRRGISNAGIWPKKFVLRFKTDAFTYLDIYGGNEWKMRATSFDCGGKSDPDCKVLSYAVAETCLGRVGCKKCFPCCLAVQEENEAKIAEEEEKRRALVKPLFPSWSQIDARRAKPKFAFVDA